MRHHEVRLADGHVISDERARLDMGFVLAGLREAYWSAKRPAALSERGWANSMGFGIYGPDGGMVGFGRLMTDYAMRGHLADVWIRPESRGRGLGKALVEAIFSHPELATVTQWTLTTSDAHGLYSRYGFVPAEANPNWMVLSRPAY